MDTCGATVYVCESVCVYVCVWPPVAVQLMHARECVRVCERASLAVCVCVFILAYVVFARR